jgi:hypothetical protein
MIDFETKAFSAIVINVLLWSTFPVIAFYAQPSQALLHILFISQVFGLLSSLIFFGGGERQTQSPPNRITSDFRAYMLLAIASVLLQAMFLSSFAVTSDYIATVALEAWPLFAFFFVAKFVKRDWSDLTSANVTILVLCGAGLALTVSPELTESTEFTGNVFDVTAVIGILLAVGASVASAATTLQANLARGRGGSQFVTLAESARVVFVLRFISAAFLGVLCLLFARYPIELKSFLIGAAFGTTSFGVASVLAVYGVRNSKSAKSVLMWFIAPPLGLFWLSIVSNDVLEINTLLGLVLLLVCNIFLNFVELRTKAVLFSTATIFITLVFVTNFDGANAKYYFEGVALLTTFYAIFVGFTVSHQRDVASMEMQIAMDMANLASTTELERAALDFEDALRPVAGSNKKHNLRTAEFLKVLTIRSQNSPRPELIVSSILGATIVVVCLIFHPNSHLESIVSVALIFSVSFSLVHVFEVASPKGSWRIIAEYLRSESDRKQKNPNANSVSYFSHVLYSRPYSIFLFIAVYAIILGISYYVLLLKFSGA